MLDGVGSLADNVAATYSLQLRDKSTKQHTVRNAYNPYGGKIKTARKGARGVAGMRADFLDGSLTLLKVSQLTARQLAVLYNCNPGTAYRARKQILAYGAGGRMRDERNRHRSSTDAPSATTKP